MAINKLSPVGTYDPYTTTRAPIAGDTQVQYDPLHDEYKVATYNGTTWNVMKNVSAHNITATQALTSGANGSYTTVSTAAHAWKHDLFLMFAEHVRVAEYINEKGKIERVQLEWREGNGSRWEPITRVQIKL